MTLDAITTRNTGLSWLALFAATGTLVCCALPIALVSIGLGATVAALIGSFPMLVTISQYKFWIFAVAGVLLLLTGWLLWRPARACPADPALAKQCERATRWNRRIFWASSGIWGIGFIAAYLALPIRIWLGM